jgi:RES domain-containing protein
VLYRNHRHDREPWWFGRDGSGRFDLVSRRGAGTCYLAQRPEGTLLEVFKGFGMVTEDVLAGRREVEVEVRDELALANCCAPSAGRFGVNAEIHSTTDYSKTQDWAAAFHRAGLAGVRYFLRSDPSLKLIGYALFAEAGSPPAGRWPSGTTRAVPDSTVEAAERYGFRVVPAP